MPAFFLGPFLDIPTNLAPMWELETHTPGAYSLAFHMQQQQCGNWCWAAVASSIEAYYSSPSGPLGTPQCQLAMAYLGATHCCVAAVPPECNKSNDLISPLLNSGHLLFDPIDGPLSMEAVMDQINQHHPICCKVWMGGDSSRGHFLVIIGYSSRTNDVIVCDPAKNGAFNGVFSWQGEQTFPGAVWNQTYLTS